MRPRHPQSSRGIPSLGIESRLFWSASLERKAAVTSRPRIRSAVLVSMMAVAMSWICQGLVHAQDGGPKVSSIELRGNKRIEDAAIRGRLTLKEGDPYSAEVIRTQIRLIYEMGFFEDVRIETEPLAGGIAVTFIMREKPFITEIVFDGNQNLSDDKLKEKITIRSQSFLDQQQAKETAERIRLAYQEDGYYNAS